MCLSSKSHYPKARLQLQYNIVLIFQFSCSVILLTSDSSVEMCRRHSHNLRSATTTLCQPSTKTTFKKHTYRCSALAVWNSLPKTFISSESVTVFKSRLKTFLLIPGSLSSLFSVAHCLATVPLK